MLLWVLHGSHTLQLTALLLTMGSSVNCLAHPHTFQHTTNCTCLKPIGTMQLLALQLIIDNSLAAAFNPWSPVNKQLHLRITRS